MTNFVWIVLCIMVACNIAIVVWMVLKSRASDEAYEKAIDEIYGRKRK